MTTTPKINARMPRELHLDLSGELWARLEELQHARTGRNWTSMGLLIEQLLRASPEVGLEPYAAVKGCQRAGLGGRGPGIAPD